jgi:hypothetical protein
LGAKVQVHLCEEVMSILGSLVMKTPGKCSDFMEGVSKSAAFTTLAVPVIVVTVMKFLL